MLASLFLGVHLLLPLAGGLEATAEALARATWWLACVLLVLADWSQAVQHRVGGRVVVRGQLCREVAERLVASNATSTATSTTTTTSAPTPAASPPRSSTVPAR
ncbi:MAG: hypothetical protein ACRDNC_15005 [Gaiellaceae bacterium]